MGGGGVNNGLFSNSLTLSEIAGVFSGSVFFSEDDTNVPYNLFGSAPYVLFSFSTCMATSNTCFFSFIQMFSTCSMLL